MSYPIFFLLKRLVSRYPVLFPVCRSSVICSDFNLISKIYTENEKFQSEQIIANRFVLFRYVSSMFKPHQKNSLKISYLIYVFICNLSLKKTSFLFYFLWSMLIPYPENNNFILFIILIFLIKFSHNINNDNYVRMSLHDEVKLRQKTSYNNDIFLSLDARQKKGILSFFSIK